jgi:hypothetical protein
MTGLMTNREWLMEQMQNMSDEELGDLFLVKYEILGCEKLNAEGKCAECNCWECQADWLRAEHKEKPKLSEAERVILENIPVGFCYIARNKDGYLAVYYGKPAKGSAEWNPRGFAYHSLYCFNHLFQFIKWEDENPYNIEELLK